jgi:hypothetical protein
MHPVLSKTFGGLSSAYYFRQFIFGLIFPAFIILMMKQIGKIDLSLIGIMTLNTFLYPYARFVYESIVGFIMGRNIFFINALFMLASKLITMLLCWGFAIFIAPLGLAWLYFHHSKTESEQ